MRPIIFDPTANVPIPYPKMNLTPEQIHQLIETYAECIVDNMDIKTMSVFVYDTIVENMENMGPVEILENLSNYYDEYELVTLIESVGANPEDFDISTGEDELTEEQIKFLQDSVKKADIN